MASDGRRAFPVVGWRGSSEQLSTALHFVRQKILIRALPSGRRNVRHGKIAIRCQTSKINFPRAHNRKLRIFCSGLIGCRKGGLSRVCPKVRTLRVLARCDESPKVSGSRSALSAQPPAIPANYLGALQ
jgi:hypothetical protein